MVKIKKKNAGGKGKEEEVEKTWLVEGQREKVKGLTVVVAGAGKEEPGGEGKRKGN